MSKVKTKTKLLAMSTLEPISLEEAKLFLRITNNREDSLIISLIRAVKNIAENYLRMSIVSQEWQAFVTSFTSGGIALSKGPVQKIDAVYAIRGNKDKILISPDIYFLDDSNDTLVFKHPIINSGLIINYTTGYKKLLDIPAAIKQGMLTHLAIIYDDRTSGVGITKAVLNYYQPYRKILI